MALPTSKSCGLSLCGPFHIPHWTSGLQKTNHKGYSNSFGAISSSPHPLSETGDEGQSYKICLRGKPLSGGRARHCLLKAPSAQVQPPSRSETTDGPGLEVNIPSPRDTPCLHRDEWHESLQRGWKRPGPTPGSTVVLARWAGRLPVYRTQTRSVPPTG